MAKYYKDTSPLAMGRKQKGSAVNKKKKKDDVKTGAKAVTNVASRSLQSSASKNKPSQASNQTRQRNVSSASKGSQQASNEITNAASQAIQRRKNYTPAQTIKSSRSNQANNTPAQTTNRNRPVQTAKEMQQNRGVSKAIQQKQDPLGINQKQTVNDRFNKDNPTAAEEAKKKQRTALTRADRQAQKSGLETENLKARDKENEERMNKTALGRAVYNAPERWAENEEKYFTNIGIALSDAGEMLNGTERNKNGRLAQDMGDLLPDSKKLKKQYGQATKDYMARRDELEAKAEERNKNAGRLERNFYSAEESGQGMLTDYILGSVAGPVGGWAVPLALRSYGGERGKAEELGATTTEDRLNAAKDAAIEVATERIGGFFGKGGGKFTKAAEGAGRDVKSAFKKFLKVGLEEWEEELIANPSEHLGENLIFRNRVQKEKEAQNDQYFADIAADIQTNFANNPTEVQRYIAEINSAETREGFVNDFKEGGMTDEQANAVADKMIEFMVAAAQNDPAKMKAIKDSLDEDLVGDARMKIWDWNEQLDVALSTWMVSGVGGAGGAINSYQQGQAIKSMPNANKRMMNALEKIAAFDPKNSGKSQAMLDAMKNEGYEPTATQAYEIMVDESEVMAKTRDNQIAANQLKEKEVKAEGITVPVATYDENGDYRIEGKVSAERYAQRYTDTLEFIQAVDDSTYNEKTNRNDAMAVAETVASYEIGTLNIAETANLSVDNPENRYVFQEMTGVDLNQYNVYDKNGKIDKAASNMNMQEKLLAMSSQNYIESARLEQSHWNDEERGRLADAAGKNLNPQGDLALHDALNSVDPRDYSKFMLMGQVAQDVYSRSYYTQDSWEDVKKTYQKLYPSLDIGVLEGMYESAKTDRAEAETPYLNAEVEAGKPMGKTKTGSKKGQVRGRFINETPYNEETGEGRDLTNNEAAAIKQMAKDFNVDVVQVDAEDERLRVTYQDENGETRYDTSEEGEFRRANAKVDFRNNVIYISNAAPVEKILHEIVHETARLAAPQYIDMAHYILDAAYKYDAAGTQDMLDHYHELYAAQGLTDAQIEEEVVADLVAKYMHDPKFVRAIANENLTALQKIKNAIDDIIRAIRNFISTGYFADENQRNSLLNTLGIYTEARNMMVRVYTEARSAQATDAINETQDQINEQSSEVRYSTMKDMWENDEKLSHSKFNSWYSAHKLNLRRRDDLEDQIADIKENGFITQTAIANVMPASINDYSDMTLAKRNYGARKGDTVLLVPRPYVDLKDDRIKNGFKPRDYEIVKVERDFQPYYELYSKAYDETHIRYSISGNNATLNGKPFAVGSASGLDGYIEETHTYEEAQASDWHHSFMFSDAQVEKIDDEENVFFWVEDDGSIQTMWRADEAPAKIVRAIRDQIEIGSARYSLSGDEYTKKQYNDYGWAKANNYLTDREYASWNEQIKSPKEMKAHNKAYDGSYMIPVGDSDHVKNKIVYTKGTKANPKIIKIVSFDVDVNADYAIETHLDNIRRLIYDQERYDKNAVSSVQRAFDEGFITSFEGKDAKPFSELARRTERSRGGSYYEDAEYNEREGSFGEPVKRYTPEEYAARFSLSEPVERVKDLIAVHNLTPTKLRGDFRLGGFPMPSIAVTNQSHEDFGEISLLFGSDTIDPKKDRANKVYSADAWTPTVPETEYEADYKMVSSIYHKIKDMVGEDPYLNYGISGDLHYESVQDTLKRNGGFDGFIDRMMDKPYMKYAFLKESGKEVEIPHKEGQLQGHGQDIWKKIDAAIPEMTPAEAYNMSYEEAMKYDPIIREILQNDFKERIGEEKAEKLKDKLPYSTEFPWGKVTNYLGSLVKFREAGGVIEETDRASLDKAMNEQIDKSEFRSWLNNLFDGVIKNEGIRNNKDPFTAMGERRSFKSLHYPVTLDGILRAMKEQGEKNVSNYTSVKTLRADTAKSFKSLDEIRKDKDKLQNLDQEQVDAIYQELDDKFYSILNSIGDKSSKTYDLYAADAIANTISECAQLGYTQPEQIIRKFKEYQYEVSLADANDILQLFDAIQNMPVNMFEAKPRRAVGFNEVKAAIIPSELKWTDGLYDEIRSELELMEIPIYEYDYSKEGDRQRVVNEAATEQDLRFSLAQKYDDEYMAAVESGDMDKAQSLVDEAAKMAGYNTKAYHGTSNYGFTQFRYMPQVNGRVLGDGFYFTDVKDVAEKRYANKGARWDDEKQSWIPKTPGVYNVYLKPDADALQYDWSDANRSKAADFEMIREQPDKDVIVSNIRDGININSTVYVIKSADRIKSADPVTYAEDGSVIPLSQRFDPTTDDIRYSLPTQDTEGNVLSDGQMEFFKNSQARKDGKLVPVYHVTRTAGFTIFDPTRAFDGVSISFSNDLDFALNYSSEDDSVEDWRTAYENRYGIEEVESDLDNEVIGHYKVYLNMENPLILEGDYLDEMDIYEWPVFAKDNGYDGVIYRDFDEDGSDIYQVFSSNQIKDTRNLNPTENPDIRYSVVDDDVAMSHAAHDDAYDDSWEALEYYESVLSRMVDIDLDDGFINHPMQVFLDNLRKYGETDAKARRGRDKSKYRETKFKNEEDWTEAFYAGLTWQANEMRFDDPVLEEGRTRMAKSRNDFFNSTVAKWNQGWVTEGSVLDINSIKKPVRDLVAATMQGSDTDRKYNSDTVKKTLIDMRLAYWYAQQGRIEIADALLWHTAHRMIENVEFYADDSVFNEYKDLRQYLRTTRIQLGEEYWADVDYQAFRKANFGRLKLVSGETNVDQIYAELEELFPGLFNSEEYTTPPDQLMHMAAVLDSIQPYKEAYSSEECAALATEIASDLLDIMQNEGKAIESVADKYEAKIQAMRTRHAEAMLKVREQRDRGIKAEKAKFKEYVAKQKEKTLHKKHYQSIQKNYKKLTERLLTNTADKNIPEQYKKDLAKLLGAFDLQTVGSKKYEARTGRKSQKTIRMGAMIAALSNIESKSGEFHVNDAITDIMDELLGKDTGNGHNRSIEGLTIDELNSSELARIDDLLKALLHEFNTYKTVKVKAKRQQVEDIGKAQVDSALKHAEDFGFGKDYNGAVGILDKIVNLDEMTASYLFRRIDPENEGLGLMYRELRLSFDHYVRNTAQLNQWMEQILGKYQNRGKGPRKYGSDQIDQWRSYNYARTLNLENGSVQLTPAQMMSIYCLAKRPQAYNHMTGAGIVVAPNRYDAKFINDIKQKVSTALPVKLTDADIKLIENELTPDQRKVAEDLQQLMANQMAAWGNEASMNVLGIELFNEPDYFPIKSDKAALISDLSEDQFAEAIRSFGFTKAVQPGAKNAIMVDDIFAVVAEHCNNMNLYNSYSEAINDFMKVYNYRDVDESRGEYTVKQAIAHAYSEKATAFIGRFIKDLNGNVSGNDTGISKMYNDLLSKAKKASVFANGRVALQQPTAIARAFYVIKPKYLKGIVTNEKAVQGAMQEMFDHCPIALWKSWGYYDIQMGRTVEDVMMNNGNWIEDLETDLYGRLDNITWTAIWQMVKAEMKDTHPDVKPGTDEYWELCNERMSEVVDLTQVVDSPMHRSHAMRAKDYVAKTATAFMAEPTLTFNMVKDGLIQAREALKKGDKAKAGSIFGKTVAVFFTQAVLVSAMAAIWDAVRGKNPNGDDDDDESRFKLWWLNTLNNFKDELAIWNKVYFVKDISSLFQGYGVNNMALQGWKSIADGFAQLTGTRNVYSSKKWYENFLNGFGYVTGKPFGTLFKDLKAIYNMLGLDWKAFSSISDYLDETQEKFSASWQAIFGKTDEDSMAASFLAVFDGKKNGTEEQQTEDTETEEESDSSVPSKEDLPDNLTDEQKEEIIKSAEKRAKKTEEKQEGFDKDDALYKALKSASGLEGEEYNKKVYSVVANGLKGYIEDGDYETIAKMKDVIEEAGGDVSYFEQRVLDETKSAYKKGLGYDLSKEERWDMKAQWRYMIGHGMTAEEISSEILYKSDMARDLKVAYRIGDNNTIYEAMLPLVDAGITEADISKLYDNRNKMDIKKYDGRYKDKLKSTGTFVWPTEGTITSGYGYRGDDPTLPAGASKYHEGIDIGAALGTPVVACDGGVVISAGKKGGYGNSVGIKHDDGTISYYNHLYNWNVQVGDTVGQGQQIGQVGSTGTSSGAHLDFRLYKDGDYLNPMDYLNKRS